MEEEEEEEGGRAVWSLSRWMWGINRTIPYKLQVWEGGDLLLPFPVASRAACYGRLGRRSAQLLARQLPAAGCLSVTSAHTLL
jgi:hypothetical protein